MWRQRVERGTDSGQRILLLLTGGAIFLAGCSGGFSLNFQWPFQSGSEGSAAQWQPLIVILVVVTLLAVVLAAVGRRR
jgi:hypothetical protein